MHTFSTPAPLLQAHHFLSLTTRQPVALSAQDKLLWVFVKDRHDYFTGEGKLWFDNQTVIASACGCSLTAAKAFISKLPQHGYLTVEYPHYQLYQSTQVRPLRIQ
ncbi:hypothetical protein [Pseudomonas syringae]|uniref:hypothetical protein n=1 Tax=Pseudomonas syringae TaxID=317 RepID=UPI0013043759|nr:hypothetical protein [Pseudomonas syringae]MCH5488322.1 helix-turn-helix domain-containing protein [Pseudomonas syringae pv. syringae]MDO1459464.1 helix-turn-helix domain-containing protein [Pseudomonas syringae pv. syringae]MEE1992153.1 hypothetical protein [Pseudomonas syringae pv. syringae]MEE1997734.1 hypothetical protein [Pseudomonas syringae pv. syringae]